MKVRMSQDPVILSEAKDLCSRLHMLKSKPTAEILRFAQDDSRSIWSQLRRRGRRGVAKASLKSGA